MNDLTPDEISADELHELISDAECGDPTPWSPSQDKLIVRALRQLRAAITKLGDYNECVFQMSEIDKSQTYRIRGLERELSEVHEANAIVTRERNDAVRDAARYRWLRDTKPWPSGLGLTPTELNLNEPAWWDKTIDAAMQSSACEGCPPVGYPTDETRCTPCPRRTSPEPEKTLDEKTIASVRGALSVGTGTMYAAHHRLAVTTEWIRGWNAHLDAQDAKAADVLQGIKSWPHSETRDDLWKATSANDSMRHMEESDISGGLTETNGGMRPTCPNCGHEPCADWCDSETFGNHPDPAKRCQHDMMKPACTVEAYSMPDCEAARCCVCLNEWRLPKNTGETP